MFFPWTIKTENLENWKNYKLRFDSKRRNSGFLLIGDFGEEFLQFLQNLGSPAMFVFLIFRSRFDLLFSLKINKLHDFLRHFIVAHLRV